MSNILKKQRIRSLDQSMGSVKIPKRPKHGWVKEIRQLLGMPERMLGKVLNVDQSTVARLEKSEAQSSITMGRLRDLAQALECELQYVLIPKKPLQQIIRDQALKSARKTLTRVNHTMSLEDQRTSLNELEQQIQDLADELIAKGDNSIWEDL